MADPQGCLVGRDVFVARKGGRNQRVWHGDQTCQQGEGKQHRMVVREMPFRSGAPDWVASPTAAAKRLLELAGAKRVSMIGKYGRAAGLSRRRSGVVFLQPAMRISGQKHLLSVLNKKLSHRALAAVNAVEMPPLVLCRRYFFPSAQIQW